MNKKILQENNLIGIYEFMKHAYKNRNHPYDINYYGLTKLSGIEKIINNDIKDYIGNHDCKSYPLFESFKEYIGEKYTILSEDEYEEGYCATLMVYEGKYSQDSVPIVNIYLSGIGKYFFAVKKLNSLELEKKIYQFLEQKGYAKISLEVARIEIDIDGGDYMRFPAYVIKAKSIYEDSYIKDDYYYIEDMEYNFIPRDRKVDFDAFCKGEYRGKYRIINLLFGECMQ